MLQFFRRNLLINIVALLVMTLAAFGFYIIFPENLIIQNLSLPFEEIHGIGIPLMDNLVFHYFLAVILIFSQALLISNIIIRHKMSRNLSLIPGAIMVLYCAIILQPGLNLVILFANFFFLLSIRSLFWVYKKFNPISNLFDSGFFLGIATLIYLPYAIYIFALLLGIVILRAPNIKETIQVILGFICPIFLLGVSMFYGDQLEAYLRSFSFTFKWITPNWDNPRLLLKPVMVLGIVLVLILNYTSLRKKKKFDAIKKIELAFWILFFGIISYLFSTDLSINHLLIVSLPISILGGLIMESREKVITKEFVYICFVGFYMALILGVI